MPAHETLAKVQGLVARFAQIGRERVEGMPIYNEHLQVEAIDFQPCPDGLLGVLITPWFINVILLPENDLRWQSSELGTKHVCKLDSGIFEFVLGEDEEVGHYLFRTVLSPTHCLKSQTAAQATARKALYDLLASEEPSQAVHSEPVELSPAMQENMGRRDFIRKIVPDI